MSERASSPMPRRMPCRRRTSAGARGVALCAASAALFLLGCNGQLTIYEVIVNAGAPGVAGAAGVVSTSGGSSVSTAGAATSSGGASAGATGGNNATAGAANASSGGMSGASGGAGTPGTSGSAGNGGASAGSAGIGGASAGSAGNGSAGAGSAGADCSVWVADIPADCHATTACGSTSVVDQNNVPTPPNPCLEGTCNSAGVPGSAPVAIGTPCTAAGGGVLCDGAGKCVRCLHASDCPSGQVCSAANQCVSSACTDTDCGGACAPCADGKKCLADADCITFACDVVSLTCITPQCQDHHQDGVETDADCGGGYCPACVLGKTCSVDSDCLSLACDAIKSLCISDACADHRTDGDESDVDCGGGICPSCAVGKKCKGNFDCQPGHACAVGHFCQ